MALDFDGSGGRYDDGTEGIPSSGFTYMGWVYPTSTTSEGVICTLSESDGSPLVGDMTDLSQEIGLFSNLRLFAIVTVSFALQIWIHHAPLLGRVFGTQPITLAECSAWIALGAAPLFILELNKWARRRAWTKPALARRG